MKNRQWMFIRYGISIALMSVLIFGMRDSLPHMLHATRRLSPIVFVCGLCLFLVSTCIASYRLRTLLGTKNIALPLPYLEKLTLVGYFFSSFLPTTVGGDVVKAFYIGRASDARVPAYTSVFVDRFVGMTTIFLMATCAVLLLHRSIRLPITWLFPVLLVCLIAGLVLFFNRPLMARMAKLLHAWPGAAFHSRLKVLYGALSEFRHHKKRLVLCFLISLAGQTTAFSVIYIFSGALGAPVPFPYVLLAMPVASLVSMIPSINGMGVREMSIVLLLSPHVGKELSLALALLWLGILLSASLIGGLCYLFMGAHKIPANALTSGEPHSFLHNVTGEET